MKTKYKFSHRGTGFNGRDRYWWWGPRIPGDSRSELVSCDVEWFWTYRP